MTRKISSIIEYTSYGIIAICYMLGCQKSENVKTSNVKPEVTLSDSRASLVHLHSDTVYILKGDFFRKANEELIIDEGTLVKVIADDFNNLGGVTIEQGGVIHINGTRNNPVVFTSNTYMGNQKENWKGISIYGKAKNNSRGDIGDSTDFSGSINYLRVEFSAIIFDGVGNKTIAENIMVSYTNASGQISARSAFNFYGGSLNARNLISYACGGPVDFYLTDGYNGKMQNILSFRNPLFGNTGDYPPNTLSGIFIENSSMGNTAAMPHTNPVISNLSVIGPNNINGSSALYASVSDIKSAALIVSGNAFFSIRNTVLMGFPSGGIMVNDGMTAANIEFKKSTIGNSVLHANDTSRTFVLQDGVYPPYNSYNLQNFILNQSVNNYKYSSAEEFRFSDPFNFDKPGLMPLVNAEILSGADFSEQAFSDPFFSRVEYRGAVGTENWLDGWTNFLPLRTNYNFSR